MKNRLYAIHGDDFTDRALSEIREILIELYGQESGNRNYEFLTRRIERYLAPLSDAEIESRKRFDPNDPYAHLDGMIFAIAYPDNVYEDSRPTLQTLNTTLSRYFPAVGGIHILPERRMSHYDVWPQDLLHVLNPSDGVILVEALQERGGLDEDRRPADGYEEERERLTGSFLPEWLSARDTILPGEQAGPAIMAVIDAAYDSHFNDGGFSQMGREEIDPRFGGDEDLGELCRRFSVMLDYVVNHMDIDNRELEAFRRSEGDGSCFIVVTPEEYRRLKDTGKLEKTFRPRPFPLFTGLRKYPRWALDAAGSEGAVMGPAERNEAVRRMTARFVSAGLPEPDPRLTGFLSIAFKVRNDQGLTAGDIRTFRAFTEYLREHTIDLDTIFADSKIQPNQKILMPGVGGDLGSLLEALGENPEYAEVFSEYEDEIFGERFFVYTTFSESQPDLNPVSERGFRLIMDDLFTLLGAGDLAMMRMDAIKYLWKEIGKRNFDMPEGNRLIRVIRLAMRLAAPRALPLDEVNSPDQEVYAMFADGGFAYLFGQVNAVPAAFNACDLGPIRRYWECMRDTAPDDFAAFVMLSTHDGRSVQGIAPQRSDGHVAISEFYALKEVVEARGGKPKFRSVPKGEIPADTFAKACREAGLTQAKIPIGLLEPLFEEIPDEVPTGNTRAAVSVDALPEILKLRENLRDRDGFLSALAKTTGRDAGDLAELPAVDYLVEWMIEGRTVYELCCTSRDAFRPENRQSAASSPEVEARRLALAQLIVLSLGQTVPAIYFNDLLGLGNDFDGFRLSGKPRDLNRRKSYLPSLGLDAPEDPFMKEYLPRINAVLAARSQERAFYPGAAEFEYAEPSGTVFLNHPYARGQHAFILGNISEEPVSFTLDLTQLAGVDAAILEKIATHGLKELLTGAPPSRTGDVAGIPIDLPAFGAVWLKAAE
jgi:hypothetical protein